MARVNWRAVGAGFAGGVVVGLIVWTQQTHRDRYNLFSQSAWRRLALPVSLSRRRKVSISPNTLAVSASVKGVGAINAPFFAAST